MNFSKISPDVVRQIMMDALSGNDPVSFFNDIVSDPANNIYFPEFFKMTKIPAGPESEHHPKGETVFDHSMIVLKKACSLTTDPLIRLAAVLHDMGKIATPSNNYPHHYQHEKLGLPLIEVFCDRLGLDDEAKKLTMIVSRNHMKDIKKISKWIKLGTSLENERQLEALKKVVMSDSGRDMNDMLDKAYLIGHMTADELGVKESALEQARIKKLQNLINNA